VSDHPERPELRSYVQVPTWTDALSDECKCRWRNDSDYGGWYLVTANPECPVHRRED
jgi:hypothetical protein